MSQDLLAEFAEFADTKPGSQIPSHAQSGHDGAAPSHAFFDHTTSLGASDGWRTGGTLGASVEDVADWGDFEGAATSNHTVKYEPWGEEANPWDENRPSSPVQSFTPQSFPRQADIPNNLSDSWSKWKISGVPAEPPSFPDNDVLFDAEAEEHITSFQDDDFGDFEAGNIPEDPLPVAQTHTAAADPLGLGLDDDSLASIPDSMPSFPVATPETLRTSSSERPRKPSNTRPRSHSKPPIDFTNSSARPHVRKEAAVAKDDDDWDDFTETNITIQTQEPPDQNAEDGILRELSTIRPLITTQPTSNELPPSNVPPPAVLISLFPSLFSIANSILLQPVTAQSTEEKGRVLSQPRTIEFLQAYLSLATVAARIIVGRKLRWKRDVRLSQSMRIGPASSGRSSGMKLTAVDKAEDHKEEREVADVMRSWRHQVGRLRSVVAIANGTGHARLGPIPELQETAPVRVAKETEGGIPAPQPCVICGLKRNERVNKVDLSVMDSFGEWWIEQTSSHRACRNFWEEHKSKLAQR